MPKSSSTRPTPEPELTPAGVMSLPKTDLHVKQGMKLPEIVDAVLDGLRRAESDFSIRTGLIICGIRHILPKWSSELADLTVAYKNRGVVAFDLAGAEKDFPAKAHSAAFQ